MRTSDKRKASRKALLMRCLLWDIFTMIREGRIKMDENNLKNIELMADKWLKEILVDDEMKRIQGLSDRAFWTVDKEFNQEDEGFDFDSVASLVQHDVKEALRTNDYSPCEHDNATGEFKGVYGLKRTINNFIARHHLNIEGETLLSLTREIAKRYIDYLEIGKAREAGNYQFEKNIVKELSTVGTNISTPTEATPLLPENETDDDSVTIQEAVDRYYSTRRFKGLTVGTQSEAKRALTDFTLMMNNTRLKDMTVVKVRTFKELYYKMPKERRTRERKKLTALQLIELAEKDKSITIRTERASCKSVTFILTFLKWLEKEGYTFNPQIIKVIAPEKDKTTLKENEKRDRYTIEELNKMFKHDHYIHNGFRYDFQFWLPLLGIFTGARLDELCQVNPTDGVKQSKDGIWYIEIKKNDEGKGIKSAAGVRNVPIHQQLIDLGFIKYVQSQKDRKETLLFPELRNNRKDKKLYPKASRWFNDVFKNEVGIESVATKKTKDEKKLDFHSFRATFIDTAKQLSLPLSKVHEVVGHSDDRGITSIYEESYGIDILYNDVVNKIHYEGLDLAGIEQNRYNKRP